MEALPAIHKSGKYTSFCRIWIATCGVRLTVDENAHIARTIGDDKNELC